MTAPEIALIAHTSLACLALSALAFVIINIIADLRRKIAGWRRAIGYFITGSMVLISFAVVTRIPAPVSVLLFALAIILWGVRKRLVYSVADEGTRSTIKTEYRKREKSTRTHHAV